jgi:hypothetical protein
VAPIAVHADRADLIEDAQRGQEAHYRRRYLNAAKGVRDLAETVIAALEDPSKRLHEVSVPQAGQYAFCVAEFLGALGVLSDLSQLNLGERLALLPPIQIQRVRPPAPTQASTRRRKR